MNYKLMFILNAIVVFAFGLGFLFVPSMVLDLFGTEQYAATLLVGRFFGTALVTLGAVLWFVKDVADEGVQKNLGMALLAGAVLGLIVTLIGVASRNAVIRSNGWIAIVVYILFGLGYGFLLFLKPRMKE